jgi:DNA-binding PucR family transcriptional regulator
VAAAELHVHVNTAYYRLDQISQRTGCDLRRFADLQQVLIAIRLVESAAQPTGTGTAAGAGSTSA